MPGGTGGLGTSGQAANTNQATAGQSITGPWQPAAAGIQNLLLPGIINNNQAYAPGAQETGAYNSAINALGSTPNLAPNQLNSLSSTLFGSQGDPYGTLSRYQSQLGGYQNQLSNAQNTINQYGIPQQQMAFRATGANYNALDPYANANPDPLKTPGIQNVLSTIQNDVQNSVNSQFAGAGRSLSGLNQQDLARGLAQGEAVPLLNQYNANVGNILQAQGMQGQLAGQLGNLAQGEGALAGMQGQLSGMGANLAQAGAGLSQQQLSNYLMAPQFAQQAPYLASGPYAAQQQLLQQQRLAPLEGLGAQENLYVPLAGLGGQAQNMQNSIGSVSGTNTASPLSQIASGLGSLQGGLGILGGLGGFF